MTIKGGTNKACAACKYQRRRCSKECPLSPYFPSDQPRKFLNAHRLFGVCSIKRILKQVPPEQRDEAMESIIFESEMRAKYPVDGCLGVARQYQHLVVKAMEELRYVKMKLAIYKEQYCQYQMPPLPPDCQQLHFDELPIYNHLPYSNGKFSLFDSNGVYSNVPHTEREDNLMKPWGSFPQQPHCHNINGMGAPSNNLMATGGLYNHQELDILADYDDIIPFDAIADDRQSFIGCKEGRESSVESSFRDATQHIEHVSKNAAACSRLTTVN